MARNINELRWAQYSTLAIGIISIIIAVSFWATVGGFALARWYLPEEGKHLAVLMSIVGNGLSFWGAHGFYQYLKTR